MTLASAADTTADRVPCANYDIGIAALEYRRSVVRRRGTLSRYFFALAAASASRAVSLSYAALSNPCPEPLATARTTSQCVW